MPVKYNEFQNPYFHIENNENLATEILEIGSENQSVSQDISINNPSEPENSGEIVAKTFKKIPYVDQKKPDIDLKKPITVIVEKEDGQYYVHSYELDIHVCGNTENEATIEFFDFFAGDLFNWLESSDEELTEDAKELKEKYLNHVK